MGVSSAAEVRQLNELELMGHLWRRAGFGATRDELEAALARGYEQGFLIKNLLEISI